MSRAPLQRFSSSKKSTEMGKSSSTVPTTSPTARPVSTTPTRPTTLGPKQINSTPRNRARPPTQRSFSTPLSRSMSVRVSKKERRWNERLADPKSPSTTYTDDYQPPEEISYKINSLNLEVSGASAACSLDSESPTTYRESFRWPKGRNSPRFWFSNPITGDSTEQGSQPPAARDITKNCGVKRSVSFTVNPTDSSSAGTKDKSCVSSDKKADVANGQQLNSVSDPSPVNSSSASTETPSQRPVSRKVNSQPAKRSGNGSPHSFASPENRPSSVSSNEDNGTPVKPACGRETLLKPVNGIEAKSNSRLISANKNSQVLTNGTGPVSLGTSQSSRISKPVNGSAEANVSSSAEREITRSRRTRAYQLQSSASEGSPFVYGSDSGSWI